MRMKTLSILLALVSVLGLRGAVQARSRNGDDINSLFFKANQDYQEGNYRQAARAYETILRQRENGYLYFNLGNCYLKMNQLGKAILNYRRAQRLIPRFPDLAMNLQYACRRTRDKIEDKSQHQLLRTIFFWYPRLNTRELLIGFLLLHFLFFLLAGIRLYFPSEGVKWALLAAAVFYLLAAGSAGVRLYREKFRRSAVVIEEELAVRSGSNPDNVILFKLGAGAQVSVEQQKGDWLKISLPDGKIGWARKSGLGVI